MAGLYHTVESLLDRHPSPAVSSREVRAALSRESPGSVPDDAQLLHSLESRSGPLRVVRRPRRRWRRKLGPPAWIVKTDPGRRRQRFSALNRRLRSSLRALSLTVEPGCAQAWARWTRLVEEERRARRALEGP